MLAGMIGGSLPSVIGLGRFSAIQAVAADEVRGATHILLQVSRPQLLQQRRDALLDEVRSKLRAEKIGYLGPVASGEEVQVRIRKPEDVERAKAALADLLEPVPPNAGGDSTIKDVEFSEPETGLLLYTLTDAAIDRRVTFAADKSVEILYRRIDEFDLDRVVEREGEDRIRVKVTGRHDPDRLKALARRGRLTFQLVDNSRSVELAIQVRPPVGSSVLYSIDNPPVPWVVENRVLVSGENLANVEASFDERLGGPIVTFSFDDVGTSLLGEATEQNVGRQIAIVVDNEVLSAPRINEPIHGGSGQIWGNFTKDSAEDLAVTLRTGELPAALDVIEQRFEPAP
jgi:SecD/SecF fusion protein